MYFDKSKVYTALNADELKVGSKVYTADCLGTLQELVEAGLKDEVTIIREIETIDYGRRFYDGNEYWNLCYLVSEPEEKKLKWTDLKLLDKIQKKDRSEEGVVVYIDRNDSNVHIHVGCYWVADEELEEWEKIEE